MFSRMKRDHACNFWDAFVFATFLTSEKVEWNRERVEHTQLLSVK
jgi:hypothetical protein